MARWSTPRGAALVAAAVDCRCAGLHEPVPSTLLTELAENHLARRQGPLLRPESLSAALEWATAVSHGTSSLLLPTSQPGFYLAFDYLVDLPGHDAINRATWDTHSAFPAVPRQLPARLRDFTGRTAELAAFDACLLDGHEDSTISAVVGTAGVGKTTFAVHWAHRVQDRFPDGTLFADLRGHGQGTPLEPAMVRVGFLQALGISECRIPSSEDAQAGLYRSALAGRRVLIVLDNARGSEQVRPCCLPHLDASCW